jgi:hypothetical protein
MAPTTLEAGAAVEREIDDEVWVPATVVSVGGDAGRPECSIMFDDSSTEDRVPLEEVRPQLHQQPKPVPQPEPKQGLEAQPQPEPELEPGLHPQLQLQPQPQPTASEVAHQQRQTDISARTRELLADGSMLSSRVSCALDAMRSDTIGSSAELEKSWQHYRSQHDVMGDRLLTFGASFPPGTWEAAAETAGGVMAELMEGVVLPTPRVPIAPENTSQLLSEALQAEKESVQRGFESSAVWADDKSSPAEGTDWCLQLTNLSERKQPPLSSLLEEFVVSEGDPRLGLIGQRAVRVRQPEPEPEPEPESESDAGLAMIYHTIPAGSVLLHYAGSVRTQAEFDEVYDIQQCLLNGYVFLLRNSSELGAKHAASTLLLDAYDGGNSSCSEFTRNLPLRVICGLVLTARLRLQ